MPPDSEDDWSSPAGLELIKSILTRLVPQWPHGPYDWQIKSTAHILNGHKQFLVLACGEGKTAAAYLHLLVLQELARCKDLPRFGRRVQEKPVVLIVTPLSDLGRSQVREMARLGIRAVALDKGSLKAARECGRDVYKEISEGQWSVVIVSPERLTFPEFDRVLRNETFRRNLALYVVDEAHVVVPWALSFRDAYADIGRVCARIPPDVPVLAMTATSRPGPSQDTLLRLLGFREGHYKSIRRSSEQPNVRTVFCTLTHGLGGTQFPDIAWIAKGNYKAIIYCRTIELGYRVAAYLWRLRPPGSDRYRNIRCYNSITGDEANERTLRALENDPDTFVVVATIKFGMGMDVRNFQVVINLGLPKTIEDDCQQRGRAGRDRSFDACGITYVQKSIVNAVGRANKKRGKCDAAADDDVIDLEEDGSKSDTELDATVCRTKSVGGARERQGGAGPEELHSRDDSELEMNIVVQGKVPVDSGLFSLVEAHVGRECLVAKTNTLFGNAEPGAQLPCLQAKRRLPCSSCLQHPPLASLMQSAQARNVIPRTRANARKPKPTEGDEDESPFASAVAHKPLTKAMRTEAAKRFDEFACCQWASKVGQFFRHMPHAFYMPAASQSALFDNLHLIRDREILAQQLFDWKYLESDGYALFELVKELNHEFDEKHAETTRTRAIKAAETQRRNATAREAAREAHSGDTVSGEPQRTANRGAVAVLGLHNRRQQTSSRGTKHKVINPPCHHVQASTSDENNPPARSIPAKRRLPPGDEASGSRRQRTQAPTS